MEFIEFIKEKRRLSKDCYLDCDECKLSKSNTNTGLSCFELMEYRPEDAERILKEWIEEDMKNIDWSTIPVDTLVEIETTAGWLPRYFSKYENDKIYTWLNGATSKTTEEDQFWSKARLVKEDK